jgi:hypothetical protein
MGRKERLEERWRMVKKGGEEKAKRMITEVST